MKIIIRDRNASLLAHFQNYLTKVPVGHILALEPTNNFFSDMNFDAVVSPANSFGFMNGGIDQLYIDTFGQQLEDNVRSRIAEYFIKELPVGHAMLVPLRSAYDQEKYLIVAPTMRVPMPILDPVDVYLAAKAAVSTAVVYNLNTIVMPGMGTGCGNVHPGIAARNMFLGIRDALDPPAMFKTCAQAHLDHQKYSFPVG